MKKTLAFVVVFLGIVIAVIYTKTRSDFPNLSRFQVSFSCHDQYSPVESEKVRVHVYLLDKNAYAFSNEVVTVITFLDSQKQFAAHYIFEDVDHPERFKESRHVYVKSWRGWREVADNEVFMADVVKNAPRKYLFYYSPYHDGKPSEPTNNLEAYENLLQNAGCSSHGPIG